MRSGRINCVVVDVVTPLLLWGVVAAVLHVACGETFLSFYLHDLPPAAWDGESRLWLDALKPFPVRARQIYVAFLAWPLVAADTSAGPGPVFVRYGVLASYCVGQGVVALAVLRRGNGVRADRSRPAGSLAMPFVCFLLFCALM